MKRNVLRVTQKELEHILYQTKMVKGMPMFATVLQVTAPKVTVKSRTDKTVKNPYQSILKVSKVSILLNGEYETAVLNQLEREGKEETAYEKGINTMPLTFGKNNRFIGEYNGHSALQYRPNDNVKPRSKYIADGKLIDKNKIADFLPVERPATNQGTDREILWRKLYVSNIIKLTFNGQTYKVIRN